MTLILAIVLIVLLIILLILFLKVRLVIDTEHEQFELSVRPLAKANIHINDGHVAYSWRVLFFNRTRELFPELDKEAKDQASEKKKVNRIEAHNKADKAIRRGMNFRQKIQLARSILSSFKVNRFQLLLNTDDAIWNAWLYPVFTLWRAKGHDVELRFFGNSNLILDIENALHRVIGALFYNYLIKPLKS